MSNRQFHRRHQAASLESEPMDDSDDFSNHTWIQESVNNTQLKRSEMNELIMDYLVREGFKEAAERFREEAGIEPVNLRLKDTILSIRNHNNNSHQHLKNNFDSNNGTSYSDSHGTSSGGCSGPGGGDIATTRGSSWQTGDPMDRDQEVRMDDEQDIGDNNSHISRNDSTRISLTSNGDTCQNNSLDKLQSKVETTEMMDKRIGIRQLIEEGDILKAQSVINLHYPELLDSHRNLHFKLQQQHLIELIRQQRIEDCIDYANDQELQNANPSKRSEIEKTMTLLAFNQPEESPYSNLMHVSRRLQLASEINDIILQDTIGDVEGSKPRLVTLLKLLIWTQRQLERKKIMFPKMTDLVNGTIEPRH